MRVIGALALSAAVMTAYGEVGGGTDTPAKEAVANASTGEQPAASGDEVAVEVNGKKLTKGELEADFAMIAKSHSIPESQRDNARQSMYGQMIRRFIINCVLLEEAKKQNVAVTDADRKAFEDNFKKMVASEPNAPKSIAEAMEKSPFGIERAKRELEEGILLEKLIKTAVTDKIAVDSSEVDKIIKEVEDYNAIVKEANAKLEAGDADAKALEKIKDLKKQLDAGADFAELAKANSDCPSSARGGDLGEFKRGQMVKEFEDVAFSLDVGKVSDPVKTAFGYHLILVTKKNPATPADGDKPAKGETVAASHILVKSPERKQERPVPSREEVEKFVRRRTENKAVQAFITKLMSAADIKTSNEFKQFQPPKESVPALDGDK